MISHILFILASICNSVMDTSKDKYGVSRFASFKNIIWWDGSISHLNKWKNFDKSQGEAYWGSSRWFVWLTDAWHFFKSLMIVLIVGAIIFYKPTDFYSKHIYNLVIFGIDFNWCYDLVVYGLEWNLVFGVFYNRVLKKNNVTKM